MTEHKGGCQCGAVRFTTTGEPIRAMACHCTGCKLRTGAPYGIGVYFEDSAVVIEGGELATFQFNSDTTGRWIQNEFCTQCGSTVSWTLEMRPGLRAIAGGSYSVVLTNQSSSASQSLTYLVLVLIASFVVDSD